MHDKLNHFQCCKNRWFEAFFFQTASIAQKIKKYEAKAQGEVTAPCISMDPIKLEIAYIKIVYESGIMEQFFCDLDCRLYVLAYAL